MNHKLAEIATATPFRYVVVKDVFDVVQDFEKTKSILEYASGKMVSPYSIIGLIRRGQMERIAEDFERQSYLFMRWTWRKQVLLSNTYIGASWRLFQAWKRLKKVIKTRISKLMKATFFLMLITVSAWAQIPTDFTYQEVVEISGTQAELYARAREWFVNVYQDANKVIQLDDKEAGTIMGKGKFSIYLSMNTRFVQHTITIEVKDGRYRYQINQLTLDWGDGIHTVPFPEVQKMYHKKLFPETDAKIRAIIVSLKKAMETPKSDW